MKNFLKQIMNKRSERSDYEVAVMIQHTEFPRETIDYVRALLAAGVYPRA